MSIFPFGPFAMEKMTLSIALAYSLQSNLACPPFLLAEQPFKECVCGIVPYHKVR